MSISPSLRNKRLEWSKGFPTRCHAIIMHLVNRSMLQSTKWSYILIIHHEVTTLMLIKSGSKIDSLITYWLYGKNLIDNLMIFLAITLNQCLTINQSYQIKYSIFWETFSCTFNKGTNYAFIIMHSFSWTTKQICRYKCLFLFQMCVLAGFRFVHYYIPDGENQ